MVKVKCLNPIAQVGMQLFTPDYVEVENMDDADVVLVRSADMHCLEIGDNIKAIARAGAGVNNIPIEECSKKGIVVFNTPGANANGVKELVVASLIMASRNILDGANWVKTLKDDSDVANAVEKGKKKYVGNEVFGKKIGIIGLGAIGGRVANACNGLGMEVYGYDPFISVKGAWHLSRHVHHANSLEEIYRQCDYISVHIPATAETKGMICKDTMEMMKDGIIILNFSRDTLINDDDMEAALKSGKVKRYVTDFPNQKTVNMEGVMAIPHLGASTEESEDNCAVMAVKQLMDFMEYGNITNSVNYPNCDLGDTNNEERILINHLNKPNMISQFSAVFAKENINISDMINKSKGEYAYSVFDLDSSTYPSLLEQIAAVEGVKRTRTIR
ncbi:phosphoglycerate dehydrogenase [Parasporobacterium paucivorans]|uniref:D-3-phosphoglycerate dehydrogenase n=1 Tax=Parasporobacterium paucivorans DSM 15970 TaxID=1122934 RepID=A0A1M6C3L6_9FIRM|nr:phosphoglycerate dehydrogenase [Parasporobacterium paucivorans]SHI55589.1 D-3-phosphoglycerate dehydrogenase [Parasporobacterium paucivorans DSM 15970]